MCFSQLLYVSFQRPNTGNIMCGDHPPPPLQGVVVKQLGVIMSSWESVAALVDFQGPKNLSCFLSSHYSTLSPKGHFWAQWS